MVDGGGPSGSVVGVGLSARRLDAVFTPPKQKKCYGEINCHSNFLISGQNPKVLPFKFKHETSSVVLSHGTIYSVCSSNF